MLHEHFRWQNMLHDSVKRIYTHTINIQSPRVNKLRLRTFLQIMPEIPHSPPKIASKQSLNPLFFQSVFCSKYNTVQYNTTNTIQPHLEVTQPCSLLHPLHLHCSPLLPQEQWEPALGFSSPRLPASPWVHASPLSKQLFLLRIVMQSL